MILIFDGNNQAHMAYHTTGQNLANGVSFGMLRMMKATLSRFPGSKIIYVFDGDRLDKERVKLLPTYKDRPGFDAKPKEEKDHFYDQIKIFRLLLDLLGIPQIRIKDCEADDIVSIISKKYTEEGREVVVVSNDTDFHQLVGPRLSLFNPITKKSFDFENFQILYPELDQKQAIEVKAIMGDTTDKIDGIEGLGIKKGVQIIQMIGSIDNLPDKQLDRLPKSLGKLNIPENIKLVLRNRKLITLHQEEHDVDIKDPSWGQAKMEEFFLLTEELDFRSVLDKRESWLKTFDPSPVEQEPDIFDFF